MKKRTIIALIVAVLLVVAGCVVLMLGLSFAGDSAAQSVLTEQEVLDIQSRIREENRLTLSLSHLLQTA